MSPPVSWRRRPVVRRRNGRWCNESWPGTPGQSVARGCWSATARTARTRPREPRLRRDLRQSRITYRILATRQYWGTQPATRPSPPSTGGPRACVVRTDLMYRIIDFRSAILAQLRAVHRICRPTRWRRLGRGGPIEACDAKIVRRLRVQHEVAAQAVGRRRPRRRGASGATGETAHQAADEVDSTRARPFRQSLHVRLTSSAMTGVSRAAGRRPGSRLASSPWLRRAMLLHALAE
jgi:hypothetical protein